MSRRIPAEFEKHDGILLSFPHQGDDWPGKYNAIQWAFVEFIKKVSIYEYVYLVVKNQKHQQKVANKLDIAHINLDKVHFIIQNTNRSWMRDTGPIVVYDETNKRESLRFDFNGWAKYPDYKKDRKIPAAIASYLDIPLTKVMYKKHHVVMEGGAIDYNGQDTLITTEECLLDPKLQVRNPGFIKQDYEDLFEKYLGIKQVIWLADGIEGDDTHGHVDDICRFINATTVVLAEEKDGKDYNHRVLEENNERLKDIVLANGHKLDVVRLPMPGRIDFDQMSLPASYANFLILNDAVLLPTFNDKHDYQALGILRELMPEREVIGISAIDLIWGLGTLHCLSHEIPAKLIVDI